MLVKTLVGLLYMSVAAEATFGTFLPHCWRKCARQAGLACRWEDAECLCKAANNGFLVKTNTCACKTCEDWAFGNDDKSKIQLKELTAICSITKSPLQQAASSAAFEAATCEGGGSSPPSEPPLQAPPAPAPKSIPSPPPTPQGPPIPPPKGTPDAPKGPTGGLPFLSPSFSSTLTISVPAKPTSLSLSYSSTLTVSVPPKPTFVAGSLPPAAAPLGGTKPSPLSSSLYASKPVGAPVAIDTAASPYYSSTVTQQTTILLIPTPISAAEASSTSASAASKGVIGKASASASKSAKPASFTGAAVRPDTQWAGSMLALAAGIVAAVA